MATKINDKAGIRATFAASSDLHEVHILPSGDHFFNRAHAEQALAESEELVTLTPTSDELKPTKKVGSTTPTE